MSNPFENLDGTYRVLANDEGQHSLWPDSTEAPAGWAIVFGPAGPGRLPGVHEREWTDLRPKSLVEAMGE